MYFSRQNGLRDYCHDVHVVAYIQLIRPVDTDQVTKFGVLSVLGCLFGKLHSGKAASRNRVGAADTSDDYYEHNQRNFDFKT